MTTTAERSIGTLEQVWETAGKGWNEAITEFHIVGGLHPELNLEWFCRMLRGLKERFPQVHLKAFTMVEIGYFARREKILCQGRGSAVALTVPTAAAPRRRATRPLTANTATRCGKVGAAP